MLLTGAAWSILLHVRSVRSMDFTVYVKFSSPLGRLYCVRERTIPGWPSKHLGAILAPLGPLAPWEDLGSVHMLCL